MSFDPSQNQISNEPELRSDQQFGCQSQRATTLVRIRFNTMMKWWQASLTERLPGGELRPYRATTADLITAHTYNECLQHTVELLTSLGATWEVQDVGAYIISH
ncbi:MAG: hypothetical protein KF784_02350 [Fimbriimonadaceae bacterium]|nr:hypothetical protein [Fimbriimonadaceae bacterium]